MHEAPRSSLERRQLAEALRVLESAPGGLFPPAGAEAAGAERAARTSHAADAEERILIRAAAHPQASDLLRALGDVRRALGLSLAALVVLGAVAGAAAARAALSQARGEPVNIFWLLGGVLGLQSVLFLVWLALTVAGPRFLAGGSIGGLVVHPRDG
jgi:hypothetical protein